MDDIQYNVDVIITIVCPSVRLYFTCANSASK